MSAADRCTSSSTSNLYPIYPYTPPEWASKLVNPPAHRLKIAQLPTPIYKWNLPGVREGYEVSIKRDDLTGAALSGNKIRKLEFVMVDALADKCDSVITSGSLHSNHARATAVISRQLGMDPHLLLQKHDADDTSIGCRGNLLMDHLMDSQIILCPYVNLDDEVDSDGTVVKLGLHGFMERYAQTLRSKGCNPFIVPVGGCNIVGIWGFIDCFRELMDQGALDNYDDIVVGVGAGGTVAGLAIANYLTGSKLKIHGICVASILEYVHGKTDRYLEQLGLSNESTPLKSKDIMNLTEDYIGKGYGLSTNEELEQIAETSGHTGILLDRVFTIKAVRGMLDKMKEQPSSFKGKRILFIHTGGIYGLFDGQMDETVLTHTETNKICKYTDVIDVDHEQ